MGVVTNLLFLLYFGAFASERGGEPEVRCIAWK
jgi:hypothetical protein